MKAIILYHPNSEYARTIEEYVRDFTRVNSMKIDLLSLETREGAAEATLYDIVSYPALMVLDDSGHLHKVWQGASMPLMNEVAGYLAA